MVDSIISGLTFGELELYIQTLNPSNIEDLGMIGWYQAHQRLQKVSQQAIFEIRNVQEETVRNLLVSHDKITVLVYEAICIQVWREKILPEVLSHCPLNSAHTFMPYIVMFHEATAITILETILFHNECCEALGDSVIDLIDYCAFHITKLVGYKEKNDGNPMEEISTRKELECQQAKLGFNIGIRCISLIRYIAANFENLTVSACSRIYKTHDIPVLLASVRENPPWVRRDKIGRTLVYEGDRWLPVHGESSAKLSRAETQLWLTLHQLLLHPRSSASYDITEYRRTQLTKLQRFLHETVIDQLSPLLDLKQWLAQLAMSNQPSDSRTSVILEVMPEIRASLLKRSNKSWKQLARKQADAMFNGDQDQLKAVAKSISETYDMSILDALESNARQCSGCGYETSQRCSRCKTYYYCSRHCQVTNWKDHKPQCNKIFESIKKMGDHN